jgi:hypothetical protein
VCHPAERVQFERSRHAAEGVRCIGCHRGNDQSLEQAAAHGSGFIGRPKRTDEPRLCASCHADEERMRPYDLPVDQYALYQTSAHGRRLAQGDTRVAVCSDCHGAHDILAASDPASRVYATNVPRTCGRCHGDPKLLGPVNGGVYGAYLSSVHARELLERANLRAPTCVSCHGVHGAAPPRVGDVSKVCGHCHTAERRYFAAGPHATAMPRAGLGECVSCHENHAIQAAQPARLDSVCADCHDGLPERVALGRGMLAEWREASGALERAAALVARADAVPIRTEDYQARLEEGRTYLREALPAAHAVRPELVASFTGRAQDVGREIEAEIQHKLGEQRWRYVGLALFWFYLLLTLLVLRRIREQGPKGA